MKLKEIYGEDLDSKNVPKKEFIDNMK